MMLYRGSIKLGKWNKEDKVRAAAITAQFLRGECPDCEKGTQLDTYIAYCFNTPINRVHNKFMHKNVLKAKYLETSPSNEELRQWISTTLSTHGNEDLQADFEALIEEEQSRLVSHLDSSKRPTSPTEFLQLRDREFGKLAEKIYFEGPTFPVPAWTSEPALARTGSFESIGSSDGGSMTSTDSEDLHTPVISCGESRKRKFTPCSSPSPMMKVAGMESAFTCIRADEGGSSGYQF